jgi:hydrogenase nickel incorporation protein HypA/HybF
MHELSIAQALIDQLEKIATGEGADAVTRAVIVVGGLSGVDPEALRMAFPVAAEETLAEDAELDIEFVPAVLTCKACSQQSHPELAFMICEQCGSSDVELDGGRELLLKSVELNVA